VARFGENFPIKDLFAKRIKYNTPDRTELLLNQLIMLFYSANSKKGKSYNALKNIFDEEQRRKDLKKVNEKFLNLLKKGKNK